MYETLLPEALAFLGLALVYGITRIPGPAVGAFLLYVVTYFLLRMLVVRLAITPGAVREPPVESSAVMVGITLMYLWMLAWTTGLGRRVKSAVVTLLFVGLLLATFLNRSGDSAAFPLVVGLASLFLAALLVRRSGAAPSGDRRV